MPFLGRQPAVGFASIAKDDFTADGSTTAFTLSRVASNANDIAVFVGNVRQEPTDAYSVSGTTLTMTAAPSSGTNFYVLHLAGGIASSTVPAAGTTVPGNFGISGDLTVDTNAFHVNATNDHIGFGTTSPATTNGAVTKVIGAKSSQNNILSGETGGIGYSGWIIEARQTGRTGQARFGQIIMNTDGSDNGQMIFQNAASGADVTESLRVTSSGLSFDSGSNHLDDYEEGTFTLGGERVSWSEEGSTTGKYVKVGRYVHCSVAATVTNMVYDGSGSGWAFNGFPFNIADAAIANFSECTCFTSGMQSLCNIGSSLFARSSRYTNSGIGGGSAFNSGTQFLKFTVTYYTNS